MKNFTTNTISNVKNSSIGENIKKAIVKAGLYQYSEDELARFIECAIEVINEKKSNARKGTNQ